MLYLKRLTLSRFKSFKHAELEFSKSFTCVVGPNGSGKSNICDALLFGLGETAIHRMRADRIEQLVTLQAGKKSDDASKATVKIEFGGDEELEVVRIARTDGKSTYRINGNHYTRSEAVEILKKYKFNINETNTITQGEINKLMGLNAKERRELIDIASGVSEFEEKKKESMRELDKVNARIAEAQIMLSERTGFLKELEKEKEAAEKYVTMGSRLKSLKYSVLLSRAKDLQGSFDSYSKMLEDYSAKRQKISAELDESNSALARLAESRQRLTRELSGSSVSIGEINKRMEAARTDLTSIEVELANSIKTINDGKVTTASSEEQLISVRKKLKENSAEISGIAKRIEPLEKTARKQAYTGEYQEQLESSIAKAGREVAGLQSRLSEIDESVSAHAAGVSRIKGSIEELKKYSARILAEEKEQSIALSSAKKSLEGMQNRLNSASSRLKAYEKRLSELQAEASKSDEAIILAREQLAQASRESGSIARIRSAFEGTKGFFGTVSQLCSYSADDAAAVEAAAGGRMDYVVVDTLETASKIIDYMKKNGAGRAAFIPLGDIRVSTAGPIPEGVRSVLDAVEFDKRFLKAFEYVFSNTYIINSVEESKRIGIGHRRYVTIDGELIEQSGVVSGGSQRKRQASAAVLDSQLRDLQAKRAKLASECKAAEETLFNSRKELAKIEIEMSGGIATSSGIESRLASLRKEKASNDTALKDELSMLGKEEAALKDAASSGKEAESALSAARRSLQELYDESMKASKAAAGSAQERKLIEESRKELESLKIRNAELTTENQMFSQKEKELQQLLESTLKQVAGLSESVKTWTKKRDSLKRAISSMDQEIKSSSDISGKVSEQLDKIDSESARINGSSGRLSAEAESIDRQINDCRVQIGQLSVRMGDVKAELAAYGDGVPAVQGRTESLEREADLLSSKIADLGNVNLKAPEIYDERRKDVEGTWSRITTLEDEKNAVLKMIEEIDSKKFKVFMDTFNAVNANFTKLYNYVFPEKASIELEDQKDPFNSGLLIKIDTGKTRKNLNSMSGGEKSMTMLLLLFAIHTYNPSSIYIFDEIDAALDKENSKKLSQFIKQLAASSQFIVVSHNDSLISHADVAVGVTKLNGESRAIGVEVSKITTK